VYLQISVIADLSFLHKYTERGGGSHTSNCFCILCGALRNFRHLGYPGGCLDCRARVKVYGEDGVQICDHYDACTEEFLVWQSNRYLELCQLVPEFPLSSLPVWEDVAQLREECLKRCVGPLAGCRSKIAKKSGKGKMTAMELSDWIMRATRDDATLSNSLCFDRGYVLPHTRHLHHARSNFLSKQTLTRFDFNCAPCCSSNKSAPV
jgi:hypothetical protein